MTGKVSVPAWNGTWVHLDKFQIDSNLMIKIDSAIIKQGKFKLQGKACEYPHLYRITVLGKVSEYITLESGHIEIKINQDSVQISGTPINDSLYKYIIQPFRRVLAFQKENERQQQNSDKTSETSKKGSEYWYRFSQLNNEWKTKRLSFIKAYSEYPIAELFLADMMINPVLPSDFPEIWAKLPDESKQRLNQRMEKSQQILRNANQEIAIQKKITDKEQTPDIVQIGRKYTDFKGITLNGDTVKFSEMITDKKLILLDFWASWCKPCLNEIPVIDNLYREYHNKGLEIIGVSLDRNPELWKKTISTHAMNWKQFIEIKNENGSISDIYGVYSIPYTILIDGKGQIVARYLRGEELYREIERRLNMNH